MTICSRSVPVYVGGEELRPRSKYARQAQGNTMLRSGSLWVSKWLPIAVWSLALLGCDSASPEPPAKTRRLPLPAGFVEDSITGPWSQPVGITFAANGRMFVWEKAGKLWEVTGNAKAATPLL